MAKDQTGRKNSKKIFLKDKENFFGLSEIQLIEAFRNILFTRLIDDRTDKLIRQGKASFLISGSGHEAVQVAVAMAMKQGKDWFFTYYRDDALALTLGITPEQIFRHRLGKASDSFSGGRQMPTHLGSRQLRMPTASSPTGTQYLQAVGAALSCSLRNSGEVVYVSGGEGSTSEGEYFEAVNWASRKKLPVIFLIQNNKYAISVPVEYQAAGGSIYKACSGFEGLNKYHIDGTDFLESYGTAKEAVAMAREGKGPALIYADVVRLRSHSASDAQEKYRSAESLTEDLKRDPLLLMEKLLVGAKILTVEKIDEMRNEMEAELLKVSDSVLLENDPDPSTVRLYMYSPENEKPALEYEKSVPSGSPVVMVDAVNHALHEEMEINPNMIIYGEDIADGKGGVFTATKGLSTKFGDERVFNSPLAEASIVGTAIGAALTGIKPVVEIQFADYIFPAMMQIRDELVMYRYRSNNAWSCPVVIRAACGGYIGGGHYHSQNIEALFAKCHGMYIAYPSNAADAKGLLKTACRLNDPVLFLEHKFLYRQGYAKSPEPDNGYYLPFGKASVRRAGEEMTVIAYGAMVEKAVRASKEMEKEGVSVEVIDLRTIVPLDTDAVFESVRKTGKVIVLHEDSEFMGFGAEIAAQIAGKCFEYLDAPVKRVAGLDVHVPFHPVLEREALPQDSWVLEACRELAAY